MYPSWDWFFFSGTILAKEKYPKLNLDLLFPPAVSLIYSLVLLFFNFICLFPTDYLKK